MRPVNQFLTFFFLQVLKIHSSFIFLIFITLLNFPPICFSYLQDDEFLLFAFLTYLELPWFSFAFISYYKFNSSSFLALFLQIISYFDLWFVSRLSYSLKRHDFHLCSNLPMIYSDSINLYKVFRIFQICSFMCILLTVFLETRLLFRASTENLCQKFCKLKYPVFISFEILVLLLFLIIVTPVQYLLSYSYSN